MTGWTATSAYSGISGAWTHVNGAVFIRRRGDTINILLSAAAEIASDWDNQEVEL
jgi:uncharacterized membrane protein